MNKKEQIIKAAEVAAREGGYNNFSFRELAKTVGIKSASVHYYFPTKEDLGRELASNYRVNFLHALGDVESMMASGEDPLQKYIGVFQSALIRDKRMCLCGLLGAETDILPEPVKDEVKRFFEDNFKWLSSAFQNQYHLSPEDAQLKGKCVLAALEGGMIVAKALDNPDVFDEISASLKNYFE